MTPANTHQGRPPNRLAREASPYLLQHAHNPVDWWPWGEEAFAEARRRGVPIFLSVGYSTCYWCHVMERESFENEAIARRMNELFVCIKVDREERPDVDELYMTATQVMSGRGGWPMSCFLEPERLRPFWCGTYFPPEPRMGMPGFLQVLGGLSAAWTDKRQEVMEQAGAVAGAVEEQLAQHQQPVGLGIEQISTAAQSLLRMLDRTHGGFGPAPKFPQPVFLELLLDVRESAGDDATRHATDGAIRLTLDRMACGGMNDQIGGGFHRYSVDELWLVPHFEKMLYDNTQLAAVYARAAKIYGDPFYERVARRTLDYVLREMTSPEGAFFSAQDAEVDGREGANYVWVPADVKAALGPEDAEFALAIYGLNEGPNFRDPHHPGSAPVNVLRLAARPERLAEQMNLEPGAFIGRLDRVNAGLYRARAARKQPRLDDKVLAGWNGMMIAAMARTGAALQEPRYIQAAAAAARFILASMRDPSAGLMRVWRGGRVSTPAVLEDYAFLVDGLLALHESLREEWPLTAAKDFLEQAAVRFGVEGRGYFDTRADQPDLFVRARSTHDGAIPSGASAMLHNLIGAYRVIGEKRYLDAAIESIASLSSAVAASPLAAAHATRALLGLLGLDRGLAKRVAALGPAAAEPAEAASDFTPVEVYASAEQLSVGVDKPADLNLVLRIKDGYHITAADPGPGGGSLIPLRVGVVHGRGIAAYADYPPGEKYGAQGDVLVHRGSVELRVAVEREGEWSGRPILSVTYQVCTDSECLAPTTVELDVSIDQAD